MALDINYKNNIGTVRLSEDLTIFEVTQYRQTLLAECKFNQQMNLDFSELEDMDTAGLQLILSLEKQVMAAGGEIFLQSTNPELDKVLDIFNLTHHFKSAGEA